MVSRFRVNGRFDRSHYQTATITVDRDYKLFSVRPLRSRREYVLPLSQVAEIVVAKIIKTELAAKQASKRKSR